jgi:hypothetical protein
LVAFFFPATLVAIFCSEMKHGLENICPPVPVHTVTAVGLLGVCWQVAGFLNRFAEIRPSAS